MPNLPDVPTSTEAGYPNFKMSIWYAMFAPADTPRDIINKLSSEAQKALDSKELRQTLDAQSITPWYGTPEQLARPAQNRNRALRDHHQERRHPAAVNLPP